MVVKETDWQARVHELDVMVGKDDPLVVPWMYGSDDTVSIDLGPTLDADESLTNPIVTLNRLRSIDETADGDVTGSAITESRTIVGNTVIQRITGLERGRWYRFMVMHGAAGNRRGSSLLIHCLE